MSDVKNSRRIGKNFENKGGGREGIFILGAIALAVIVMIVIGTINDRSPITGVKRSIYEVALPAIDVLESEFLLDQVREGENAKQLTVDDYEYISLTAFSDMTYAMYYAWEANNYKKYTQNAGVYIDTISLVWETQQSEAAMMSVNMLAEEEPALAKEIEGFEGINDVINIYDKIWHGALAAAKSNDIKQMEDYLNVKVGEYDAEMEPYRSLIEVVSALLQEIESQLSGDSDEILGNADPSMFEGLFE